MKNLIQRWTQSRPCFENQGNFFDFQPPSPHQLRVCHVMMKPKFLLLTLIWQNLSMFNVCILTQFSYTLFIKELLLFHISLLKLFIYRRVNTSQIHLGATIPAMLTKNQVKAISIDFVRKKYLLPAPKKNQATRKTMMT